MKKQPNYFVRIIPVLIAGFILTYCSSPKNDVQPKTVTPETALESYLNNGDTTFHWSVRSTYSVFGVNAYDLFLTSQQWREHTWVHQLTVLVPTSVNYDGALLWITGGRIKDGEPRWASQDDGETVAFAMVALNTNAVVAVLRQVPNQPLYDGLTEDALISYTLHQFKNDGDYTWPLLFPMTKSAVRAMDAIQEFTEKEIQQKINRFVVSGASKRGWTTWLTGAWDDRVDAIGPAVIDVLNMPVNLDYQIETWGDYSYQIQDYVELGIAQDISSDQGKALATMIDPYSYREKLTIPKMIFIGTNDPYWPVDAIKNYIDDIPGQNFIHYVPNAGHDLGGGETALRALTAFFVNTLMGGNYPELSWNVNATTTGVDISVQGTADKLVAARLWIAGSTDRDFRNDQWSGAELTSITNGKVETTVDFPDMGFKAFYIDLEYPDQKGGTYTKSTRMFVTDENELFLH